MHDLVATTYSNFDQIRLVPNALVACIRAVGKEGEGGGDEGAIPPDLLDKEPYFNWWGGKLCPPYYNSPAPTDFRIFLRPCIMCNS